MEPRKSWATPAIHGTLPVEALLQKYLKQRYEGTSPKPDCFFPGASLTSLAPPPSAGWRAYGCPAGSKETRASSFGGKGCSKTTACCFQDDLATPRPILAAHVAALQNRSCPRSNPTLRCNSGASRTICTFSQSKRRRAQAATKVPQHNSLTERQQ